jgi:transposase
MSFDLYGQKVSDDTILKAIDITYKELAPFEVALKALILLAYVLGADETGVRVLKKLYWLHILATPTLTWYGIHKKRGKEALDFFEILEFYKGRLVHDCWQAYFELQCMHALCNAHLLRELVFIHEQMKQDWAKSMSDLLLEMNKARDEQMKTASSFPEQQLIEWDQRYDNIVAEGREVNPLIIPAPDAPKKRGRKKQTRPQNLLDRFVKHKEIIMAFAYDFQIPVTNNISEQAVRMHKVKQKVSGCFRTVAGAGRFARIRSYISTARKQGLSVFQALKDAIVGKPFIPEAPPSG